MTLEQKVAPNTTQSSTVQHCGWQTPPQQTPSQVSTH
jgi:hypothetical protein